MNPSPLVSVIVPCYRHEKFVEETLRSIFRQTWQRVELLVFDDGSPDQSVAVIERVLKECPFPARLIARENRGLPRTLNEGLDLATGDYLAVVASDDRWLPRRLELSVAALERAPEAVMAFSHCYFIDREGTRTDVSSRTRRFESGWYFWRMISGNVGVMSPTVLFRTSALRQVRWTETSKVEDYELYLGLSLLGPFEFVPEALAEWRYHGNNMSADPIVMTRERINVIDRMAARLGLPEAVVHPLRERVRFEEAGGLVDVSPIQALAATLRHWRGAASGTEMAKRLVRIGLPRIVARARAQHVIRDTEQR